MKPKIEGPCVRYCLLCSGACDDKPKGKGSQQVDMEIGEGGGEVVNCDLLKSQLKNMFILLKLLDVPKNWCEGILGGDPEEIGGGGGCEDGSNPDSWFTLCAKCDHAQGKVQNAWRAYRQMIKWGNRLNAIKVQIKQQMRKGLEDNCLKERFYSDDGIEVVNYEVGKLLFPDLFEEMVEEEDEDVTFSSDDDVDHPGTDLVEGRTIGSGCKGVSLSVLQSGPAEGARVQINGITEKKKRGRPRKTEEGGEEAIKVKSQLVSEERTPSKKIRGRPRKLNLGESDTGPSRMMISQGQRSARQVFVICEELLIESLNLAKNKLENKGGSKKIVGSKKNAGSKNFGGSKKIVGSKKFRSSKKFAGSRKIVGSTNIQRSENNGVSEKRGRGRPRKIFKSPKIGGKSSSVFQQVRNRLRGRPRKTKVPLRLST